MSNNLKLWVVQVVREAYVVAATEEDAEDLVREIDKWEEPRVTVSNGSERLEGWDDDCYVYHIDGEDMSLARARREIPAA